MGAISADYAQIIADGSSAFASSGSKVFVMDAGEISLASPAQIGRVIQGETVTAATVEANQELLDAIGVYCRTNDIQITVEAQLDDSPEADWTYQWLAPAVAAALPITAVENVDEVEVTDPASAFPTLAADETAIVGEIVKYYPAVAVGQWEGGNELSVSEAWWSAYDNAADADSLPNISYVVADTSWNCPWQTSETSWSQWLTSLVTGAHAIGMQVDVLLDGVNTDISDQEWTAQSEQHAAMLASLAGVQIDGLLIRSWTAAYPTTVGPSNVPTSISNDALEIAAVYSLYQAADISAVGSIVIGEPAQLIVYVGQLANVGFVDLIWDGPDLASGKTIAVVLTDANGTLYSSVAGSGIVQGSGTNTLTLDGTAADIATELGDVSILEASAGPDTIDIEVFGAYGRLEDTQTQVIALPIGDSASSGTVSFSPSTPSQEWTSATATLAITGRILSESLSWNSSEASDQGTYQPVATDSIYEPLVTADLIEEDGRLINSLANPSTGSSGSLPIGMSSYNNNAFNPTGDLTSLIVLSTSYTYSSATGELETATDRLAATPAPASLVSQGLANYLADGGIEVTQYNTGNNLDWAASWSPYLASVTTTFDSAGNVLEQVFQGGSSEPYSTLIDVYDPYTGTLWEQFQTASPEGSYSGFVSGLAYVTEYNTGDNPNWDWQDWGGASEITVTWQDYYAIAVTTSPPTTDISTNPSGAPSQGATLFLQGTHTDYLVIIGNTSFQTVESMSSAQSGAVSVVGYDEISFSDGVGIIDVSGVAEEVARLYEVAFDRSPDLAGLEYWTQQITSGVLSFDGVAMQFLDSSEGSTLAGLSNVGFIQAVYNGALHRPPDPTGFSSWLNDLDAGMSRATMIADIANSPEVKDDTMSYIGSSDTAEIYRLYQAALGRQPDAAGLEYWTGQLDSGVSEISVAALFLSSSEFQDHYGSLTDLAFVDLLYTNALGRPPDSEGQQDWLSQLSSGTSRASVLLGFSDSLESKTDWAAATHDGWIFIAKS